MLCTLWGGALRVLRWAGWGWASVLLGGLEAGQSQPPVQTWV